MGQWNLRFRERAQADAFVKGELVLASRMFRMNATRFLCKSKADCDDALDASGKYGPRTYYEQPVGPTDLLPGIQHLLNRLWVLPVPEAALELSILLLEQLVTDDASGSVAAAINHLTEVSVANTEAARGSGK